MARSSHEILESATTIAVVGASRDPNKAGGSVPEGLQRRGFRIIPINPFAETLFGERVYRSLLEVPDKIDLVDVFRPAGDAPEIARQAVAVGAKALWLQEDIRSAEARRIADGRDRLSLPVAKDGRVNGTVAAWRAGVYAHRETAPSRRSSSFASRANATTPSFARCCASAAPS